MSKIFLNNGLIWCKDHLPTEEKAMKLLQYYVHGEINPEAALALSCGITVKIGDNLFEVELSTDKKKEEWLKLIEENGVGQGS